NDLGREYDEIPRFQHHVAMLAADDAPQRRPRLPLAAGRHIEHLVGREIARILLAHDGRHVGEIAEGPRRLEIAHQRPAHKTDMAIDGRRRRADGAEPRAVGREGGDDDASRMPLDGVCQTLPHREFGAEALRLKTLVESQTKARMPWSPIDRRRSATVARPTSGSGSSFQSTVWNTRSAGVSMSGALGSGIEWVSDT